MRTFYQWMGCFSVILCTLSALAQPPRPSDPVAGPVRKATVVSADEQLAAMMYLCCRNEVELAQFAEKRLKTEEGREFAKMLLEHHQAACEKLQKLAAEPLAVRAAAAVPGERPTDTILAKPEGRPAVAAARQLDWLAMHQQISERYLKSAKEELVRYEGDEFDKAFIGQQLGAHLKMLNELRVFEGHASDALRGQIKSAQDMVEAHLKQARAIMDSQKKPVR